MRWTTQRNTPSLHHSTTPLLHYSISPSARLVLPRGNAPRSSAYQAGALLLSYGRERLFSYSFFEGSGPRWPKGEASRADPAPRESGGFVALAKEQLALVSDDESHGVPLVWGCG